MPDLCCRPVRVPLLLLFWRCCFLLPLLLFGSCVCNLPLLLLLLGTATLYRIMFCMLCTWDMESAAAAAGGKAFWASG